MTLKISPSYILIAPHFTYPEGMEARVKLWGGLGRRGEGGRRRGEGRKGYEGLAPPEGKSCLRP